MHNYYKVGGILSIVAGGFGALYFVVAIILIFAVAVGMDTWDFNSSYYADWSGGWGVLLAIMVVGCLIYACLGALAIVGGVFGLRKKLWGLALAGSIAGMLVFFPCGVLAIIFTALAKPEYDAGKLPASV